MSGQISDDDLSLSVTPQERLLDSSDSVQVGAPNGKQALKSMFGPSNRKRMIFIAVAFLFLISMLLYTFFSFSPDDGPVAESGSGGQTIGGRLHANRGGHEESMLQAEERERYNYEVLEELQKENPAAHPLLNPGDGRVDAEPEPEPLPPPNPFVEVDESEPRQISDAVGVDNSGGRVVDPQMLTDLVASLMDREGDATKPQLYGVSWKYAEARAAEQQPEASSAESESLALTDDVTGMGVCANPLMRAGSMSMATTDIALNSDVGGPVSVTVRSGPLRGTQLLGNFERADTWLRLSLSRLVTRDETLDISAIALDMDTTLNAVSGDVNRHIMYRYGWWGLGSVLKAVGKAAERTADTRTVVSDGVVIQDMASDSSRELQIAVGELGQDIGEVMRDRLDRPITVTLNVGDEIGVFFLDDVCSDMPAASGA